jgi:hypothetical protein
METKIQALEISMAELKTDLRYIKDSVKQNAEEHKEIIDKIDGFIQSAENRFAAKAEHQDTVRQIVDLSNSLENRFAPRMAWTILIWAGGIIGMALILGVVSLLAETYLHIFTKLQ